MTNASPKPKINKLGLVPVFVDIVTATVQRSITSPFHKAHCKARTYRRDVFFASLREILGGFSCEEGQYLVPSTDKVYQSVSESKKWKANSINLEHGAKGHWLGHHDAKYVMMYIHGGGYIAPATPGHMKYQFALQEYLRKQGIDISIFSLSYHLAPQGVYPTQIKQALAALQHVIEKDGRDPGTILIGGDSAGGNLCSALLLHLGRPHPLVSPKEGGVASLFRLQSPLKAALLISPWISFETQSPSFKRNRTTDYMTTKALNKASQAYVGPGKGHDEYSEPINARVDHWTDVANHAVERIMIWGGGGEILIDSIKAFGAHVREGFSKADTFTVTEVIPAAIEEMTKTAIGKDRVKVVVTPREAHEEMIVDYVLMIRGKGEGAKEVENWLTAVLKV